MDHGIVNGRIIGGGSGTFVSIHSGSEINGPPPQVPDTGSTFALLSVGLAILAGAKRKFRS